MGRVSAAAVMHEGQGSLKFLGFAGPVIYEVPAQATQARHMQAGVRGVLTLTPETARDFYRAGEATLSMDDGKTCRIVILGHTEGSEKAYFQTAA